MGAYSYLATLAVAHLPRPVHIHKFNTLKHLHTQLKT